MAYDYKRHTQTARIQALSDLLKTVNEIQEPNWAAKEAIRLENDMILAKHKAEITIEDRDNKLFDEYKKLDELTANELSSDKYLEGIIGKDPLYKPEKHSWWRSQELRRKAKRGRAERDTGLFSGYFAEKNYKKLRQKDFAQMLPDMTARIGSVGVKVATAGTVSTLTDGKAISSIEKAKGTVMTLYNQLYSSSYQKDFLGYASATQRQEYFTGLAEMHGMMKTLGLEIPEYDVLSDYETSITKSAEY